MYRLIVCYGRPEDPAAFDEHYRTTHSELARKVPGLLEFHAGKCVSPDGKEPPYYLVAELVFESRGSLEQGLASDAGKATARDMRNFASGGATVFQRDDWIAP